MQGVNIEHHLIYCILIIVSTAYPCTCLTHPVPIHDTYLTLSKGKSQTKVPYQEPVFHASHSSCAGGEEEGGGERGSQRREAQTYMIPPFREAPCSRLTSGGGGGCFLNSFAAIM